MVVNHSPTISNNCENFSKAKYSYAAELEFDYEMSVLLLSSYLCIVCLSYYFFSITVYVIFVKFQLLKPLRIIDWNIGRLLSFLLFIFKKTRLTYSDNLWPDWPPLLFEKYRYGKFWFIKNTAEFEYLKFSTVEKYIVCYIVYFPVFSPIYKRTVFGPSRAFVTTDIEAKQGS